MTNDVRDIAIERIVPGGMGLAHDGGKVILTPLTAPGDRVRVRIVREQERVAFGEVEVVVEAGPDRIPPRCPSYERCGGCDFQHLRYEAQLAAKVEMVRDCLRRIAGIEYPDDLPIVPSPDPELYRSRAEWHYDPSTRRIGYFAPGTHDVVEADACGVLTPPLAAALAWLQDEARAGRLPEDATSFHAAEAGGRVSLLPPVGLYRTRALTCEVGGFRYRFDAACFFQANLLLLPALVEETMRFADPRPRPAPDELPEGEEPARPAAIDLYCGVGLFTLPLARRFERVVGVDVHAHAVGFARQNVSAAGLDQVRISAMPVEQWLATRARSFRDVDLVVLDPPRAGVDPAALAGLIRLDPWRIAYVSCDPATLARDLKRLVGAGYEIVRVAAQDVFPQTHHVEIVAHLARRD